MRTEEQMKFRVVLLHPTRVLYFTMDELLRHVTHNQWYVDYPNARIDRWTGLHDKNGKEIYEGDIVDCWERVYVDRLLTRRQVRGEVQYCDGVGCFAVSIPDGDGSFLVWEFRHYSDFEVIGNIYSKPELIK